MNYVYKLSYNGVVFYVGCTKRPMLRFLNHTSCENESTRWHIQKNIKETRLPPTIQIVAHFRIRKSALRFERERIIEYKEKNHLLCNAAHNSRSNMIPIPEGKFVRTHHFKFRYDYQAVDAVSNYVNKFVRKIPIGMAVGYNSRVDNLITRSFNRNQVGYQQRYQILRFS